MWLHTALGDYDFARLRKLYTLISAGNVTLGGYTKTKIYGTINCRSGKRMKPENRAFFANKQEAIDAGYRPCAHCMPAEYQNWKNGLI